MLPERPDNPTMLQIYALFKQGWSGDNAEPRPGFTDLVGRAKWDAWDGKKGMPREEAMRRYIELIDQLKG
jgi:diazepam-binding inhibitor (GABA receptor modulating acyl-CoA-binding protein)